MRLDERAAKEVIQHLADLWSYDVTLREVDAAGDVAKVHSASPRPGMRNVIANEASRAVAFALGCFACGWQ